MNRTIPPRHKSPTFTALNQRAAVTVKFIEPQKTDWGGTVTRSQFNGDIVMFSLPSGAMKVFNFQEIDNIDIVPEKRTNGQVRHRPR